MIDKIWYAKKARKKNDVNKVLSAPVFPVELLDKYANKSYFGHVHEHKNYGSVTYVGPFTRWEFGTNQSCGYITFTYDANNHTMIDEYHVDNKLAPKLVTAILKIEDDDTVITVSDKFDKLLDSIKADRLLVVTHDNPNNENKEAIRTMLINKSDQIEKVRLSIKESEVTEEKYNLELEEKEEKLNYIWGMDLEERVNNFIKVHFDKDIPVEEIKVYMNKEE